MEASPWAGGSPLAHPVSVATSGSRTEPFGGHQVLPVSMPAQPAGWLGGQGWGELPARGRQGMPWGAGYGAGSLRALSAWL